MQLVLGQLLYLQVWTLKKKQKVKFNMYKCSDCYQSTYDSSLL